jgi:peroxisomal membrane protein 4
MVSASNSFTEKLREIFNATYQHSRNLALYVSLYKLITCLMRHFRGVESPMNSLVGGAVGGAIMFGSPSPVNSQVNMYGTRIHHRQPRAMTGVQ